MPRYTQPRTGYNKPLLPVPVSKFVDGLPVYGSTTETSAWRVYVPPPYIPPPYRRRWPDGERVYPLDRSELLESNAKRPINQLPPEVLAEIFLKFLEDCDDKYLNESTRPLVSRYTDADPTLLGHICSYWRAVALSTPMLWSRICILFPKPSHVRLTELWLERAGNCPLNLYLMEDDEPSGPDAYAARDLIISFAYRLQFWSSIYFNITSNTLAAIVPVILPPARFQHIDSVELHVFDPSSGPITRLKHTDRIFSGSKISLDDIWGIFHASPTLRRINWGYAYDDITFPAHCPGHQLTDITLFPHISMERLLDLLASCPELEKIWVYALCLPSTGVTVNASSCDPILLPKLHTFNITTDIEIGQLLRRITLPALGRLKLHYRLQDSISRDPSGFREFLARANCGGLKEFYFTDSGIGEEDLHGYLDSSLLRNVRELWLRCRLTDGLLRRLKVEDTTRNQTVMPNLELLDLRGCETSDGVLSDMVLSRWSPRRSQGCNSIKKVYIAKVGTYGLIDKDEFSRMQQGGLKVTMSNM